MFTLIQAMNLKYILDNSEYKRIAFTGSLFVSPFFLDLIFLWIIF